MEEDFPTRGGNQFMDDDNDSLFLIILILFLLEYLGMMDDSTAIITKINKANSTIASTATMPKEKKNVIVKRDIIRKKEPVNIVFLWTC
jgi:hypothetical protein